MERTPKRLYKSRRNRVVAGVIGGVGEYFNVDPVLLRVAWILLVIFTAVIPGIISYIFAALIIPERPAHGENTEEEVGEVRV